MKVITKKPDGSIKVSTENTEPSKTQQQFKDDTDVNVIMRRFLGGKSIPPITSKTGVYGDFTQLQSYQQSLNTVLQAQEEFSKLPSEVRRRFSNNPKDLINFLSDKKNDEEAYKLGLRVKPQVKADPIGDLTKVIKEDIKSRADVKKKPKDIDE